MSQQFESFGKYMLLEKLAVGGMAEVYLAKSTGASGVNKFLAIKRILPQFSQNQEFIEMFKEEAKIAVNLNHSNVVSIFDFGVEQNQFYLVMEYVEGRNLRQILNEFKKNSVQFTTEQIVFMMKEVAAGLDHAHRCIDGSTGRPLNITHRDMSPQNIMVSFEGEVKVIDFGIAKAETQLEETKAGTLKGKFGYMSPEQADGHQVDLRTDIFSMGIVLWELLANDRLFTSNSEAAILRKIRECEIPSISRINPSIPPELEKIVNKALAKDKNIRYQTAAALHRDLNRFLNTHYPEFSPHDFSIFIKNSFTASYQEQKRKLVEFAKAKGDEKSLAVSPNAGYRRTRSKPVPNDATQIDNMPDKIESDAPAEFKLETPSDVKVDLSGISEVAAKKLRVAPGITTTNIENKFQPTQPTPKTKLTTVNKSAPNDVGLWIARAVILFVVVFGGNWGWKKFSAKKVDNNIAKIINDPTPVVPNNSNDLKIPPPTGAVEGKTEQASKASFTVTINSNPSGARIFIDGQDTDSFTPNIRPIEGNKPVVITLKKDNFLVYEKELTVTQNAQILEATLQPMTKVAYIAIRLTNAGQNPVIEVNGRRLTEKGPIDRYPIPADVPVIIKASNPFTGTFAEQTINVGADQKKTVHLVLTTSTQDSGK